MAHLVSLKFYRQRVDFFTVRELHPLQQGLRRVNRRTKASFWSVRELHPLQQGLRLKRLVSSSTSSSSQRATSITTRIKTITHFLLGSSPLRVRELHPLQQGLRLKCWFISYLWCYSQRATSITTRIKTQMPVPWVFLLLSESYIHYNKD